MFGWVTKAKSSASQDEDKDKSAVASRDVDGSERLAQKARIVSDLVEACRTTLKATTSKANDVSGEAVLATGNDVDAILKDAQDYVQESRDAVCDVIARQVNISRQHLGRIDQAVDKQAALVNKALQGSEQIGELGATISRLAAAAKMLTLNIRIEASRLGVQGSAFAVLAQEMTELSSSIGKANENIGDLTKVLRTTLPAIRDTADEISADSKDFASTLQASSHAFEDLVGLSDSNRNLTLDSILKNAYAALSHLQFQDPLAQELQRIDLLMENLHKGISHTLNTPMKVAPALRNLSDVIRAKIDATPPREQPDDPAEGEDATAGDCIMF